MGVDGQKRVVVDSLGRERDKLEEKEATPGKALQLTLDLDLQAVAELAMDGRRGAVVALDPRIGRNSRHGKPSELRSQRVHRADQDPGLEGFD